MILKSPWVSGKAAVRCSPLRESPPESSARARSASARDADAANAHDLKGLGATYQYPLVTRLAGSLCKMIDDPQTRLNAPMNIIDGMMMPETNCAAKLAL